jgi:Xaa-Pro aminopeptidase
MIPEPYKTRLQNLRTDLKEKKLDSLLISRWIHIRYLTGYRGDDSWALVTPAKTFILSDFRYQEEIEKGFPWTRLAMREKGESLYTLIVRLAKKEGIRNLGFESREVSFDFYTGLKAALNLKIKLFPTTGLIEKQRIIKTPQEIRDLDTACRITDQVVSKLLNKAKVGLPEIELKRYAEDQIRQLGGEGPSFDLIIVCGPKTSRPHAVSDKNRLKSGTQLMFDMGSKVNGYHSDLTRTFFTSSISTRFRQVYDAVLEAQEAAMAVVRPGVRVGEVDLAARRALEKRGLAQYFGHSTGHGVGLEIHEAPTVYHTNRELIREDMVFTIEPGVYIPGWGGIRIEDIVRVTKTGYEVMTKFPKNKTKVSLPQ